MPDYFTLLRDRVTLKCRSIDSYLLASLDAQTPVSRPSLHLPPLAAPIQDPFFGRLWQDWRRLCPGHP